MSRPYDPDEAARDNLIQSQPILWAQAMLYEAEKVRTEDARDAILARIGTVLLARFGVTFEWSGMRRADERWIEREITEEHRTLT